MILSRSRSLVASSGIALPHTEAGLHFHEPAIGRLVVVSSKVVSVNSQLAINRLPYRPAHAKIVRLIHCAAGPAGAMEVMHPPRRLWPPG